MKKTNITLIGMPTSGKSTVGVIVAKILGMDFVDADLVIQSREGMKLSEIIDKRGIDGFVSCEGNAIMSIEAKNTVIATGGSAVYSDEAMKHLAKDSVIVYLKLEKEELFNRLSNAKERGVVLHKGETLDDMFNNRAILYAKYADLTVEEKGLTMEETVESLVESIKKYNECL
ncbi:shikimate kinase [Lachnospira multipara]|uniref:shikimate kinase n=1 Tax=Lachnospira multipara TaxID=28051 RepID=UPI000485CB5F|nr:shikimate kinase [Lachnospira multipara]